MLTERARLGVDVERGPVEGRVVLQDARLWDLGVASDSLTGPTPLAVTGVYEAWGEAHTSAAHPSFVRIGRQAITWGEGRLLGASDWSPTGRTLDAVRGRLVTGQLGLRAARGGDPRRSLDAVLAAASGANVYGVVPAYGQLFGARAEWALDPLFAVDAYGLARIAQSNPFASLERLRRGADLHAASAPARGGALVDVGRRGRVPARPRRRAHRPQRARRRAQLLRAASRVGDRRSRDVRVRARRALPDGAPRRLVRERGQGRLDLPRLRSALCRRAHLVRRDGSIHLVQRDGGGQRPRHRRPVHGRHRPPWSTATRASRSPAGAWTTGYLNQFVGIPGNTNAELGHEIDARFAWSPWVPVELAAGYSMLILGTGAKAVLEGSGAVPAESVALRLPPGIAARSV